MSGSRRLGVAALLGGAVVVGLVLQIGEWVADPDPPPGTVAVMAIAETEPVPHEGDAADDPAIWVDRRHPGRSVVIGTDKLGGIAVYDLAGRELQYRPDGDVNNVDVRQGFPLGSQRVALVAATNRSSQTVALYSVDPETRELVEVNHELADPDLGGVNGICMYGGRGEGFGFFVTGLRGEVEQWEISEANGGVAAERVRAFGFEGSTEACVVDERSGSVYFGEEKRGIWRLPLEPGADDRRELIDGTGDDGKLVADVEGLAVARLPGGSAELIASSQGSNSYVAYRLGGDHAFLYSFRIVSSDEIDGAEDTDGLEVTTEALGPDLPNGLLVVQDGENDDGNQNFKLVPLCMPGSVICGGEH